MLVTEMQMMKQMKMITSDFLSLPGLLISLACVLMLFFPLTPNAIPAQDKEDNPVGNWLTEQAMRIDLNQRPQSSRGSIRLLLSIAESFEEINQPQNSQVFLDRAISIAEESERHIYHSILFAYANRRDDLQLATKFANAAKQNKNSLLDRLDLMRYRLGDSSAIANYPRGKQTLYNAFDLAQTYVEKGEFEAAERFATGIKISEENDPRAVTGFTLHYIAEKYQEQGNQEKAEEYADKAVQVAGDLFYTGFVLKTDQKAIHGTLTEGLDQFARLAANHPGHMGRELTQQLIRKLSKSANFAEAKQVTKLLKAPKDVQRSFHLISLDQVQQGNFGEALRTIEEEINDSEKVFSKIEIARILCQSGETAVAMNLAEYAFTQLKQHSPEDLENEYHALAMLYGQLGNTERLKLIFATAENSSRRMNYIEGALKGYASRSARQH